MRGAASFFTSIDACTKGGWTLTKRTTAFSLDEFVGERLKWRRVADSGGRELQMRPIPRLRYDFEYATSLKLARH